MSDQQTFSWLVLVYKVPSEPSRLRAAVWRRLKAIGAVYLQNSVAALPSGSDAERALRGLRNEIREMGGTSQLLRADAVAGQRDLVELFNGARDEEYEEIVDRCNDFLTEIETETAEQHFTYAELEENDEDLAKLHRWFEKVKGRDVIGAERRQDAEEALEKAKAALEGFAAQVYAVESEG